MTLISMADYKINKQYRFPLGHIFHTEDGKAYKVTSYLGRGGQGEAYRVIGDDGEFAVKFYNDQFIKTRFAEEFYKNLQRNVANGIPKLSSGDLATQFIWPMRMICKEEGSFGYLMKLFPEGYEPFGNVILQSKLDKERGVRVPLYFNSWFVCVTAALNIVRAFEILHASGYSYQDLNQGGFSVNMKTGSVLICDCDNVAPDKTNLGILGVMNYMAPEVIMKRSLPNRHTDEYSLAVVLFRLFFHGHPMEGMESRRLHNSEFLSRYQADEVIYGKKPRYCLDSKGNENKPDLKFNRDVCKLCFTYPMSLMNAFEQVFTQGVNNPSMRLTATEWRKVLLDVRDHLVLVDGKEEFFGVRKPKPLPKECRVLDYPGDREVLLMPDKILYQYHLEEYGTDFKKPVGKIIKTNKPGVIGLYNASGLPIHFYYGGKEGDCPDQRRMPLLPGMELAFGRSRIVVR